MVNLKVFVLSTAMIIFGSITTMMGKLMFQTLSDGKIDSSNNTLRRFAHPWFQTTSMFFGEFLCFPMFLILYFVKRRSDEEDEFIPLIETSTQKWRRIFGIVFKPVLFITAGLDLLGSSFLTFALLHLDASVSQMLRGSLIIIVGIFSRIFLRRLLSKKQWISLIVCSTGIVLISISTLWKSILFQKATFSNSPSYYDSKEILIGISLTLLAQIFTAFQMIIQEKLLKNMNIPPLQIVGLEGLYGLLLYIPILIIMYFIPGEVMPRGNLEDVVDALIQISNNKILVVFISSYILAITFFNFVGVALTKYLSCVHRSIIDSCRTITIWIIQIILFYSIQSGLYGEEIDAFSLLKVDGFILLVLGTVLYNYYTNEYLE